MSQTKSKHSPEGTTHLQGGLASLRSNRCLGVTLAVLAVALAVAQQLLWPTVRQVVLIAGGESTLAAMGDLSL